MQDNYFPKIELIKELVPYRNDPTGIFNKICGNKPFTLLLESSEVNKKKNLKSIMLVDTALRIIASDKIVKIQSLSNNGKQLLSKLHLVIPKQVHIKNINNKEIKLIFPDMKENLDEDSRLLSLSVFDCFRFIMKLFSQSDSITTEIFFGGLFSYDLACNFEFIKKLKIGSCCPDFCFYLSEILVVFDHKKKTCEIKGNIFGQNNEDRTIIKEKIKKIKNQIINKIEPISKKKLNNIIIKCNIEDENFKKKIKCVQNYIHKGEIFQAVISRTFSIPCYSNLSSYITLKKNNPSPYMFFMQDSDFILFGTSPESSLKYDEKTRKIELYPIAGTRVRGTNKNDTLNYDLDSRVELEMRLNNKELAEHLMLVDLARNDLAKICNPGSRYVSNLVKVDRYSFVMHLVSKVIGKLKSNLDALHAYRACMNMGTLSGAPKVRAMEIISKIEKLRRGSYGGAIGYFTSLGKLDTCIIIRSAYIKNNIANVQAGAGIVLDSIPQLEADESRNKAKAVITAIYQTHLGTNYNV